MEATTSLVQRPQTLGPVHQHTASNGFQCNAQQPFMQPVTSLCTVTQNQQPPQNVDIIQQHLGSEAPLSAGSQIQQQQQQEQRAPKPPSTDEFQICSMPQNINGAHDSVPNSVSVSSTLPPNQATCSDTVISLPSQSDASSSINGVNHSSGIPRLRPSAIPRLVNPRVADSAEILKRANSNNNASPHRTMSSYTLPYEHENPISLPQTPSAMPPHPFVTRTPPIDPPDLVDASQHMRSFYNNDRSRTSTRPSTTHRLERTASENPQRPLDNESDTSSAFSSSGTPRLITSKVNSLKNVHHKPGGGNVSIVNEKVHLGPITSKCNSFANVKHKPGGGNVAIVDEKLDLSGVHSKISSLKNVKHVPGGGQTQIKNDKLSFSENAAPKIGRLSQIIHTASGGDVQIVSHKLDFDKTAKSKIGSLKNAQHRPSGGDVQIFREQLPWLKYNKPNLPPEERARINKQRSLSHSEMSTSVHSGSTGR